MKFIIDVDMEDRFIPAFLGMLQRMQYLGEISSDSKVSLECYGSRGFRPKFDWNVNFLPKLSGPISFNSCETVFG